jgi:hypothetical protein
MRTIKILVFLLSLASFGLQAQIRDDFDVKNRRTEVDKLVSIYPNPAIEFVNIRFNEFPASRVEVTLYNIIGNEVPVETETIDEHEIRLRVKELSSGYYLIVCKNPQDRFHGTFKILKR